MKVFIRICWLVLLFAGSVFFFGSGMTERFSGEYVQTVKPEEAELPILSVKSDGVVLNTLYGHVSELEPCSVRESFATLENDGVMEVLMDERKTDVRKLLYVVYDTVTGEKLDEGKMSAFDVSEENGKSYKTARIKPVIEPEEGREYALELTLITSDSKRVYYYFRFKQYDEAFLKEKVNYMLEFSKACREKNIDYVIPYLESTYRGEGKDYAFVNIKDSYFMVCWGNMKPELVSDIKVSINEIYKYIAVGTLKYTVSAETPTGKEMYVVTEKFRINLGKDYAYLLNYERELESVFDPALMSLTKTQLKLGITGNTNVDMLWTADNKNLFFVRDSVVYCYNLSENVLTHVYSMRDGFTYPSDVCEEHNIHLLRVDEAGNLTFMVSGYINCGEYEGKTGILLYTYYKDDNRIKELLYIPIAETAGHIANEVGQFSYMNGHDVFFFMAYGHIYSYSITTAEFKEITSAVVSKDVVFCDVLSYVAWQEKGNNQDIFLLYLESGERSSLHVGEGELITLLGYIGDKMITGYGSLSDEAVYSDESVYYPISHLKILDSNEQVVKEYYEEGYYITDIDASSTSIRLTRVMKTDVGANFYAAADDDYILIYEKADIRSFAVETRATQDMLTEYYLSLPSSASIKELPKEEKAELVVINENTSIRVQALDDTPYYEIHSYGNIIGITDSLSDAIVLADTDKAVGTVTYNGRVLWERGVQNKTAELSEEKEGEAIILARDEIMSLTSLNHAALDEMLYFIYKDIPVYAVMEDGAIILLTGYDQSHVTYRIVESGKKVTERLEKLSATLEKGGNIFRIGRE